MLYDLSVWLAGLILLTPILVFGLAWARISRYYHGRQVHRRQKISYMAALVAGSVSTLAYLGYWSWRVCQMYHATLPLIGLLTLDRLIYVSRALSMATIACLLFGRGPYRMPLALATLWVTFQLWVHGDIIHWA
ncbi:membrane hypothetical protein [Candidatus Sulfotelmatobacter kueseliae]|uniref:Uncharacterized protein n=1 Tax=Candidatus Sulfotelmatobacter kueseliae TaxID=2042962 RepID=A0A2U3KI26_9BACT|nr:membrane hypothetical protein [Candidatus Sulfotelmatobacter kueseliae]